MRIVRFVRLAFAALVPAVLLNGCASMSNTEAGALGGGAIGAGTGALIGHAVGHTAGGALIGAGVGALSGGLIGNSQDKAEQKQAAAIAAATAQPPLSLQDVATLAQQHVSDNIIVSQIRSSGSVYNLTAAQIVWLKENGVSDVVVAEMQATAYRYPRRVYSPAPVVYQPVVVYEQPPPPPVSVGVGVGYTFRR